MIEKSTQNITFINDFDALQKSRISQKHPSWLNEIKNFSLKRLNEVGLPKLSDEDWKYTNISAITQRKYKLAADGPLKEKEDFLKYYDPSEINIVLINGKLSDTYTSRLNNLPKGIEILPLNEAITKYEAALKNILTKYETQQSNSFVALNTVLVDSGVFIKIAKNIQSKSVIHISHVTSSSNGEALILPRTVVEMGESSEGTILESHVSFSDDIVYFSNALTDIYLNENAVLNYCKAQKESLKAFHIGTTRVWQERNSTFNGMSVSSGSTITRNNLDIVLNGEGSNSNLNGLYCNSASQLTDNHTFVDHRMPNCISNQLYKGILNEASRGVFNGKILVRPIAQKTNSYQLNKTLLLGKDARIDTKPQLEIFADDVKCTHGATIGQLDPDEIFYLQTRNIGKSDAKKMLARGFVDDLINRITNPSILKKLNLLLETSFAQLS